MNTLIQEAQQLRSVLRHVETACEAERLSPRERATVRQLIAQPLAKAAISKAMTPILQRQFARIHAQAASMAAGNGK